MLHTTNPAPRMPRSCYVALLNMHLDTAVFVTRFHRAKEKPRSYAGLSNEAIREEEK